MFFQLTTSRRGRRTSASMATAAMAFQLTTSRRGRPYTDDNKPVEGTFNSRPHAEVDASKMGPELTAANFQLTTSRRGRLIHHPSICPAGSFNSRPHAEVDFPCWEWLLRKSSFNSRPHAEVDNRFSLFPVLRRSFNSRPHAEVDINISHILCKISILFLIFFTKTTLNKAQKYEYYFIFAKINC